jgi:hypothetical protein
MHAMSPGLAEFLVSRLSSLGVMLKVQKQWLRSDQALVDAFHLGNLA